MIQNLHSNIGGTTAAANNTLSLCFLLEESFKFSCVKWQVPQEVVHNQKRKHQSELKIKFMIDYTVCDLWNLRYTIL
jgi:hypothetical protein